MKKIEILVELEANHLKAYEIARVLGISESKFSRLINSKELSDLDIQKIKEAIHSLALERARETLKKLEEAK